MNVWKGSKLGSVFKEPHDNVNLIFIIYFIYIYIYIIALNENMMLTDNSRVEINGINRILSIL